MPALILRRATPVREDDALVRVLEASIETLKAEKSTEAPARRRRGAGGARNREGGRGDRRAQGAHAAQDVGGRPWRWPRLHAPGGLARICSRSVNFASPCSSMSLATA